MLALSLALGSLGLLCLLAAPALGRFGGKLLGGKNDPGALAHLLRIAGMFLLVGAIVFRPHSYETAAFPPPPDVVEAEAGG